MLPRLVVADEDPEFLQRVLSLLAVGFNVVATAADGKNLGTHPFSPPGRRDPELSHGQTQRPGCHPALGQESAKPAGGDLLGGDSFFNHRGGAPGGRAWICVQEVGSARLGLGREISLGRKILPFPLAFGSVTTCAAGASWSPASCFRRTRRTFHDPAPNADHRIYRGHLPAWMFCADRRIHTCRYQNLAEDHP